MSDTAADLDRMRRYGDELADATVRALFDRGEVGKFNTLMRYFSTTGQDLPEGLPEPAREYLEATAAPPEWVDWSEMERRGCSSSTTTCTSPRRCRSRRCPPVTSSRMWRIC